MKNVRKISLERLMMTMILIAFMIACAFSANVYHGAVSYPELAPGGALYEGLSMQNQMSCDSMRMTMVDVKNGKWTQEQGEAELYAYITSPNKVPCPSSVAEQIIAYGFLTNRIDDLKAAGRLRQDYVYGGSAKAATPAPAAETPAPAATETPAAPAEPTAPPAPKGTEFTVTDADPYPAWVTNDCNPRSGADATWDIIGSLKKWDKITVTGTASTGWLRFKTDSIREGYIISSFVTTNDPYNQTVSIYNPNTGNVEDYTFPDTPPDVVEAEVEKIRKELDDEYQEARAAEEAEKAHVHSYESKVTKEATCASVGEVTYTCECGDTYTEPIAMTVNDHVLGEWEVTKQASWTKAGERVQKCKVCGKVINTEPIAPNPVPLYIIIGILGAAICAGIIVIAVKKRKKW